MRQMGRVPVFASVLLCCLVSCHAEPAASPCGPGFAPWTKGQACVTVNTRSGYGRSKNTDVATCELGQALENATECLQQQVGILNLFTSARLEAQQEQIDGLRGDVDALQGKDTDLWTVFLYFEEDMSDARALCEIYTIGEALEIASLVYDRENPNPHFVHLPCGDDCPKKFWKIRQNCFRPNDPPLGDLSPLARCVYDPLPEETCTRRLYIGADGYTTNLSTKSGFVSMRADRPPKTGSSGVRGGNNRPIQPLRGNTNRPIQPPRRNTNRPVQPLK